MQSQMLHLFPVLFSNTYPTLLLIERWREWQGPHTKVRCGDIKQNSFKLLAESNIIILRKISTCERKRA